MKEDVFKIEGRISVSPWGKLVEKVDGKKGQTIEIIEGIKYKEDVFFNVIETRKSGDGIKYDK